MTTLKDIKLTKECRGCYSYSAQIKGVAVTADISYLDDERSFGYTIKVAGKTAEQDGCYGWTLKMAKESLLEVIQKVEAGNINFEL